MNLRVLKNDEAGRIVDDVLVALGRIESKLTKLEGRLEEREVKEFYTVRDAAIRLRLACWTVRNACRTGRISAVRGKRGCAVGGPWRIPHQELVRILNHGLSADEEGLSPIQR